MINRTLIFLKKLGVIRLGASIILALLIAEILIHRHTYFAVEALPFFYPIFGFIAFLIVVGGGVILRRFVSRDEDYYDDQ